MDIQTKEIAVVKTQVSKAITAAESIEIKTDEQMLEAGEIKKKIKVVGKMVKEKKEAITKPLEQGKLTEKQAERVENKIEKKLEEAPQVIKKSDNFQTREIKKFRIINEMEVPREYLMIDEVKVRKAMMAGIVVSGVEYYTDKIIV